MSSDSFLANEVTPSYLESFYISNQSYRLSRSCHIVLQNRFPA